MINAVAPIVANGFVLNARRCSKTNDNINIITNIVAEINAF